MFKDLSRLLVVLVAARAECGTLQVRYANSFGQTVPGAGNVKLRRVK